MDKALRSAIKARYIKPLSRPKTGLVGVEFELPIVNLDHKPVDFDIVHQMTDAFMDTFHFSKALKDDDGHIYNTVSEENGDDLSFDCSYNTVELSFAPVADIHTLENRFKKYYSFMQDFLAPHHHTLTGMGINPHYNLNHNDPIHNGRYRMLFHHLGTYKRYGNALPFHDYPNYGLFACASQVQLDADRKSVVETLNAFNRVEPYKSLLFANSLFPDRPDYLLNRDWFWEMSTHGINPHNVGMYDVKLHSVNEIIDYLASMSMYCVEKRDKYINFEPTPLLDYFTADVIEGEYFDGDAYQKIRFQPSLDDLPYLRAFKYDDLTFRGTIECRSVCTQPVSELFAATAFQTGLNHNIHALTRFLGRASIYRHGYSVKELRDLFNREKLPAFADERTLKRELKTLLSISKKGLQKRGLGEEIYLKPLYQRAKTLHSPARDMAEGLSQGKSIDDYIIQYAKL